MILGMFHYKAKSCNLLLRIVDPSGGTRRHGKHVRTGSSPQSLRGLLEEVKLRRHLERGSSTWGFEFLTCQSQKWGFLFVNHPADRYIYIVIGCFERERERITGDFESAPLAEKYVLAKTSRLNSMTFGDFWHF